MTAIEDISGGLELMMLLTTGSVLGVFLLLWASCRLKHLYIRGNGCEVVGGVHIDFFKKDCS